MASDLWVHTCTYLEKHYRKKRDENLGMQRVQVRTAIDRWTQDALQPGENPVEQWRQRSYESMTLLQLTIADLVSPRLRDTISQDLLATVDEVAGQQCELTTGVPNVGLDVVAPSVLSLAAGIGVVRGVVFVLDYSGVSLHGSWWILAAIVVGLMFMGIVAMLRYRQHEEKIQSLLITGVRSEMNRRVEELMAKWFFSGTPFDAMRDNNSAENDDATSDTDRPLVVDCVWPAAGTTVSSLVPRRVALVLDHDSNASVSTDSDAVEALVTSAEETRA